MRMALPLDTTPAAAAVHQQAYRALTVAGRLKIALELSDLTRAFAIAGMRRRNPNITPEEAHEKLANILYGSRAIG